MEPGITHTHRRQGEARSDDAHAERTERGRAGAFPGLPLAHALVRVDVGLAVGTRVRHVLEVIEQAGDQAAAEITPGAQGEAEMLSWGSPWAWGSLWAMGKRCE